MTKKFHKRLKELHKLQALHGTPISAEPAAVDLSARSQLQPAMAGLSRSQDVVRRDLMSLAWTISFMVALLLVMNWLVATTAFDDFLIEVGRKLVNKN